ncbi:DUF397 domain-containing protein [Streptomyces rubradiris]|uniref:DUF397 domain-containing protein n=1 Tax=Streptomyces rubradiris TaxID=285531 RepID=UPI003F4CF9E8
MDFSARWHCRSRHGAAEATCGDRRTRVAVRDSKAPARATLTFPAEAFALFVEALKAPRHP